MSCLLGLYSQKDSVRAKLLETTKAGRCAFGVYERLRVKETIGKFGVWTGILMWNNLSLYVYFDILVHIQKIIGLSR